MEGGRGGGVSFFLARFPGLTWANRSAGSFQAVVHVGGGRMITAINATNGRSPGTQNVRPWKAVERGKRASTGHTSSAFSFFFFFSAKGKSTIGEGKREKGEGRERERRDRRERSHEGIGEFSFLPSFLSSVRKIDKGKCCRVG